ncbi:MAG: ATP-binding cassette domain-containing protein [Synergistales bacterium]|jgi:simple sugar transport system ATP-binding protein|nr:ATP-binding cassette domain-containing protein [Synergistales bacterium]
MEPAVTLRGITKSFGPIQALRGVDLDLEQGEVLALLGDNGAGKSTLVKILSGLHVPDSGTMTLDGKLVDWRRYDVARARKMGVETVYQERSLGEKQPLWRNVFVGRHLRNAFGLINVRREKEETMKLLSDVLGFRGVGVHPEARVASLSGGERQGLAIARAMYFDAAIIVLDEPTTALGVTEAGKVLSFVERLRGEGHSCLFVSHELHHVHRIADRFALMERGRIATILKKSEISLKELAARLLLGGERKR